jgi:hypothetical protein
MLRHRFVTFVSVPFSLYYFLAFLFLLRFEIEMCWFGCFGGYNLKYYEIKIQAMDET